MFRKQIKIKSNCQLGKSEKKNVIDFFTKSHPNVIESTINKIFPKKESISLFKIETATNTVVDVYFIQKRAIAFKVNNLIIPTIFTLWNYPELLISFSTYSPVLSKLSEGADLMIPGVIFPDANIFTQRYGTFETNTPAYVNLENNRAAVAVGVTVCNSGDMFLSNKGKCLHILHTIGDKLCTLNNLPILPIPELGPPYLTEGSKNDLELSVNDINLLEENQSEEEVEENEKHNLEDCNDVNSIDKLLQNSFLSCIKFSKNINLPILTSTFYKTGVVPYFPENVSVDLKKTSYKKLSNFLKEMAKLGVITLHEKQPGVHEIIEINGDHTLVTSFNEGKKLEEDKQNKIGVIIEESVIITAAVLPIFSEFGLKKDTVLQKHEVRNYVKEYVKLQKLQNKEDPMLINVNSVLSRLFKEKSVVTWEELFQKLFSFMGNCFKIQQNEAKITQKGKLEPIILTIATRSGNKKVTLVNNLETYGINIENFAKECQLGVAASTTINSIKGKKSRQLLVQGNQITFLASQLQNKYKIPTKFISGLEHAPKKKN